VDLMGMYRMSCMSTCRACAVYAKKACIEINGLLEYLSILVCRNTHVEGTACILAELPYILESNALPFYSFRGLKNQMRIRFACGLDSRAD
jgi:hypothetical protein